MRARPIPGGEAKITQEAGPITGCDLPFARAS